MPKIQADQAMAATYRFHRLVRTHQAEEFVIFSDTAETGRNTPGGAARVGHCTLFHLAGDFGRPLYACKLYLEVDWTDGALEVLISEIESRLLIGDVSTRADFSLWAYQVEERGVWSDRVTEDRKAGADGLFNQVEETQRIVQDLPEKVGKPLGELIERHYEEIESIIQSDIDEATKRERIRKRLTIGLEKMIPTIMWEFESLGSERKD